MAREPLTDDRRLVTQDLSAKRTDFGRPIPRLVDV
jgi:hypothetical protein